MIWDIISPCVTLTSYLYYHQVNTNVNTSCKLVIPKLRKFSKKPDSFLVNHYNVIKLQNKINMAYGLQYGSLLQSYFTGAYTEVLVLVLLLLGSSTVILEYLKKEKIQVILSALSPLTVIPRRLSTLHRCSLTTVAEDKSYNEKLLIRDCRNHKGSCTLFWPYLTIAAGISSSSFVRVSTRQLAVSSLSKGISSTLNFHESIGTDGTRTRNLRHPKRAPYQYS